MPSTSDSRRSRPLLFRWALAVACALTAEQARGTDGDSRPPRTISPVVITSFEQIWQMPEAEAEEWHRLRLDYTVYYYDPLWQAMWGRSGEADSYLSLGKTHFPIKAGQRVLIEGLIRPINKGLVVDEPVVTVLADSTPVDVLSTRGEIGNIQRFDKKLVTVEGYVNRQTSRDANHQELELVVDGRVVVARLLLKNDDLAPQANGALVRVKGVYYARTEPTWPAPKVEVWVPSLQDIEILGQLDRDARFQCAATLVQDLANAPPDKLVRLAGVVREQAPGESLTLSDGTGTVTVPTAQTQVLEANARVEVIGFPLRGRNDWSLTQALYRPELHQITTLNDLLSEAEGGRNEVHTVQCEFTVYFYDPEWKVLWGRWGDVDTYLGLREYPVKQLKPGQRILITGLAVPAKGAQIDQAKITIVGDGELPAAMLTRGQVGRTGNYDKHVVTVEGYVDRQYQNGPRHMELDLVVGGRSITVWVLLEGGSTPPNLVGTLLEARGVYSATSDPLGALPKIELWVPGLHYVAPKGLLNDSPQFNLPATSVENLATVACGKLVRVDGVVRMQEPGKSLTIRDETGQVTLQTAQAQALPQGTQVEAIGYIAQQGAEWQLSEGLYRRAPERPQDAPSIELASLRLAEQVRELSPEAAARGHPVQLTGIVTWASGSADFFYMHDSSGGVCVIQPPVRNDKVVNGAKVIVVGVSGPGRFTPVVLASSTATTARLGPPEAKQVTLEQTLTGVEDSQWLSMSGYVRRVTRDGPWSRLELSSAAGEFTALLGGGEQLASLRGSVVQVRGVCQVLTNAKRQLTGIQLWVPSTQDIAVLEAEPAEPFKVAARSLANLRQFNSLNVINRRVRVTGAVVHQIAGEVMYVQEGTESLLILSHDPTPLDPGDRVEAVGFPGREGNRVVLRDAIYRKLASGPEPAPQALTEITPNDVDLDGRLVRITAMLLDSGTPGASRRLVLQARDVIFEAQLERKQDSPPVTWVAGSRVALTGVYQVEFDEYKRPHAVRLLLRSPADIQVISRPSWLTVGRVLAATGVLAVCLVLGFGWVVALRRRVRQQTGQIQQNVESERAARLEAALARASKLESLGVLAGGIAHDFNNLLTVVMGNLSLAKLDARLDAETMECLRQSESAALRARDLTHQLITFAKGGEPVRTVTALPAVVLEAAQFALHGSKARCDFDLAPEAWPADVDRGQIGQVVQNIILNATHAMPAGGVIRITLRNVTVAAGAKPTLAAGNYLRLSIADSGTGIAPDHLSRIFEPYFTTKKEGSGLGLATVYSIIKKHQGHVEAESKPGAGTTFHLWLPAASTDPVLPAAESKPVLSARSARVLFMDDEATIRSLAGAIFKRMGLEHTAVADGLAVLREFEAARSEGRPYDLVMLDLTVPGGMGGAEAMERLRQIDPGIRAIVSSGYSNDPVMANYLAHGFQGRVSKPYEIPEFMRTLAAALPDRAARG